MEAVESRISHKVVKADSLLTRAATARRKMISSYLEKVKPKVLEIGAFDNATFHSELGDDVHYLDFFSADELKEMHNGNPRRRLQHTVTVDYVVKSKHFAVEIDQKFDLIVANHVIEHILDVIFWFKQLESLLTKDGTIFLSVPDRRFTFDYFRNVSSATQMIRAHEEKLEMPDYWQLLDHFYYHQKVNLRELWEGVQPSSFKPRFSLLEAMTMAKEKSKEYTDAHCWVFTDKSFEQCVRDLQSAAMLNLEIHAIKEPMANSAEFHVLLKPRK